MNDCSQFDCTKYPCTSKTICKEPIFNVPCIGLTAGSLLAVLFLPKKGWVLVTFTCCVYIFLVWFIRSTPCVEKYVPTYLSTVTDFIAADPNRKDWHPNIALQIYVVDLTIIGAVFLLTTLFLLKDVFASHR